MGVEPGEDAEHPAPVVPRRTLLVAGPPRPARLVARALRTGGAVAGPAVSLAPGTVARRSAGWGAGEGHPVEAFLHGAVDRATDAGGRLLVVAAWSDLRAVASALGAAPGEGLDLLARVWFGGLHVVHVTLADAAAEALRRRAPAPGGAAVPDAVVRWTEQVLAEEDAAWRRTLAAAPWPTATVTDDEVWRSPAGAAASALAALGLDGPPVPPPPDAPARAAPPGLARYLAARPDLAPWPGG